MTGTPIEVDFRLPYPNGAISNLAPNAFTFRGVDIAGMEGLLVATKYPDPVEQLHVVTLHGFKAMYYGKKQPWWEDQLLHWQGTVMEREGSEYQDFLDEAYTCMFDQNENARTALLATGDRKLTHNIGGRDPQRTVLTVTEFCGRLMSQRRRLQTEGLLEF